MHAHLLLKIVWQVMISVLNHNQEQYMFFI